MKINFDDFLSKYFLKLTKTFGFNLKNEIYHEEDYYIEWESEIFLFKLEHYKGDINPIVYTNLFPRYEFNLFNLLEYLDENKINLSNYFTEEKNLLLRYEKQFQHISIVLYQNYSLINEFFKNTDLEKRLKMASDYIFNKFSDLFLTVPDDYKE